MLKGLYKVEMETVHGSRRGVLYVYDGKYSDPFVRAQLLGVTSQGLEPVRRNP